MKRTNSALDALEILERGEPLVDAEVNEPLDLTLLAHRESYDLPLQIVRSTVVSFDACGCMFSKPVVFRDVLVKRFSTFAGAYFFAGLHIRDSWFWNYLDFVAGGHNRDGAEFYLGNSRFLGFVDFEDCWFEGPVRIEGCQFAKGTNLLGLAGTPVEVQFDVPPVLRDNVGRFDCRQSS